MKDNKYSRKSFLKKAGFVAGSVIVSSQLLANSGNVTSATITTLNDEDLLFLKEYATWLKEFNRFVHRRKANPLDSENNMRLMMLSEEAVKRKPKLELLMQKPAFMQKFNEITEEITHNINE